MNTRELKLEEMYVLIKDEKDIEEVCAAFENIEGVSKDVWLLSKHLYKNIGTSFYGVHFDKKGFIHVDQLEYLESVNKFKVSLEVIIKKLEKEMKND